MSARQKSQSKKLLDFLHGLYAWQNQAGLTEWILEGLPILVSGDNVMVGQHDPKTRIPLNVTIKHPTSRPNLLAEVSEAGMMEDHPFWEPNPNPQDPIKILSNMMTRAEWERFPMYCELLREDGVRDHITTEFIDAGKLFYIAVARSSRGYSRKDQETLALLTPHFHQAFNNAAIRRFCLATPDRGPLGPLTTHQINQRGDLAAFWLNEEARWVRLFGARATALFEELKRWTRQQVDLLNRGAVDSTITPLRVKWPFRAVEFRIHRRWGEAGYLLSQRILVEPTQGPNPLSAREMDVLLWVREGKTNREIGVILGVSPHTVKDHLKRVYDKLGVDNRTAAAMMFRQEE